MDAKITHRLALGTIIGGLAAGPFVMHALRKNQKVTTHNVPPVYQDSVRRVFFEDWKANYNRFNTSFERVDGIDSVELRSDLKGPRNWKFQNLLTTILGSVSSPHECTVGNLGFFEIMEGTISIDNRIVRVSVDKRERRQCLIDTEASQKTGLKISQSVAKEDARTKSSTTMAIETDGNSQLIEKIEITHLEKGSFAVVCKGDLFLSIDKNGREISSEEDVKLSNYPISLVSTIFPRLIFPYPKTPLKQGELIRLPEKEVLLSDSLPATVIFEGVEKFDGIQSAKLSSDQIYNTQQLCDYYHARSVFLQGRGEGANHCKKQIEDIAQYKIQKRRTLNNHIDLGTGLTVRQDFFESITGTGFHPTSLSSIFRVS
ncbi:MAG: hypothetical protein ACRC2T_07875 [Thermoguttaceae bacterium]